MCWGSEGWGLEFLFTMLNYSKIDFDRAEMIDLRFRNCFESI
jgi:hypothetical protein